MIALEAARVWAASLALASIAVAVKFEERDPGRAPSMPDAVSFAVFAVAQAVLASVSVAAGLVFAAAGALLFLGLWLDATVFRVYSIEFGFGGLRGIALPALYSELAEVAFARRFLFQRIPFAVLPLLAAAAYLTPLWPAMAFALGPVLLVAAVTAPRRARWRACAFAAAFAAFTAAGALHGAAFALLIALGAAALLLGIVLPGRRDAVLATFFLPRRPPPRPAFQPRADHAALFESLSPRPARHSERHGTLAGESVILWTVESLGRDHLAAYGGPARTPFLDGLLPAAAASANHFAPCPLTNDAHTAFYNSSYAGGASALGPLRAAGYRAVYLSPYRTAHFGLDRVLRAAGFDAILDQATLGRASDSAILEPGLDALALEVDGGPFFLHVHTNNTHLPYRVEDPARFAHFDGRDDYGRYLNAIEEADALLADFLGALERRGIARDPLVLVSADHGQAFGELGYRSHGSAVVKEQVNVPFVMAHPRLAPARFPWSSHFDVLPTVLDLLGIEDARSCHGDSLFAGARDPALVVWAGKPARTTTSNLGIVFGDRKYMLDLILGHCHELDWHDRGRVLEGEDAAYYSALVARAFNQVGLE